MASAFPDDIVVDAQPENNLTEEGHASGSTVSANGNKPTNPKPTTQQKTNIWRDDDAKFEALEKQFCANKQAYSSHFKPKLKYDPIDIAVIHVPENRNQASIFRNSIVEKVKFEIGKHLRIQTSPNVVLYDEFIPTADTTKVDEIMDCSHYIFLYVTEEFCQDNWKLFVGYIMNRMAQIARKSIVVPIHTMKYRQYTLPATLDGLDCLLECDEHIYMDVGNRLHNKQLQILNKLEMLHTQRIKYFVDNYDETFSKVNIGDMSGEPNESPMNKEDCLKDIQQLSISDAVPVDCEGKCDSPEQNAQRFHKGKDLYSTNATPKNSRPTAAVTPFVKRSSPAEPDSSNNVLYGTDLADLL